MKRHYSLIPLSCTLFALCGCGGGKSDFRPALVGNWRVRSFSINNGAAVNCPSNQSAGNFFDSCTAQSIFTFREDGTVLDPAMNTRAFVRKGLTVTYYDPAPVQTTIAFSGDQDNILLWSQPTNGVVPTIDMILERL